MHEPFKILYRWQGNSDIIFVRTALGEHFWLRGFTYKDWTCYITGENIKASGATLESRVYAWRIDHPRNLHEASLRVAAHVFDL